MSYISLADLFRPESDLLNLNFFLQQVLDSFGRTLTDHSDDEAGVVAMLRFLSGVVDQLPSVSLCAAFWIGIAGEPAKLFVHDLLVLLSR